MPSGVYEHKSGHWQYRFWKKVQITDDCWFWKGSPGTPGYGELNIDGIIYRSHRLSYEMFFGPVPEGRLVCHICDNKLCVNPKHLFLGTRIDNAFDMIEKGYRKCRDLTWDKVKQIRERYSKGGTTQEKLALEYNVGEYTISKIVNFKVWNRYESTTTE